MASRQRRLSLVDRLAVGLLSLAAALPASIGVLAQSPPPVPKPRPQSEPANAQNAKPIEEIPIQPKPDFELAAAKTCEATLRKFGARFSVLEPVDGEGQCGWPRPLKLKQLSGQIMVVGESMLRCEVALAMARWSKDVVVPSARLHLGTSVSAIEVSTTYQCRRRNNAGVGKLSEHGFANGVDLLAVHLVSGDRVIFRDRRGEASGDRAFQAAIRGGACAYFTTVLGPMANPAHSAHFHFDLAVRQGGYRICE